MPFCRKCGRRLPQYSESCPECGTSTTSPLINLKKAAPNSKFKVAAPTKIAKAVLPVGETSISVKAIKSAKSAETTTPSKSATPSKSSTQPKPTSPTEDRTEHKIVQSKLSIEEDIITNPHDYETQTFSLDLECRHNHFFPAGATLPVSKGKAYCPICGEQLRNHKHGKPRRYRRF